MSRYRVQATDVGRCGVTMAKWFGEINVGTNGEGIFIGFEQWERGHGLDDDDFDENLYLYEVAHLSESQALLLQDALRAAIRDKWGVEA